MAISTFIVALPALASPSSRPATVGYFVDEVEGRHPAEAEIAGEIVMEHEPRLSATIGGLLHMPCIEGNAWPSVNLPEC